MKVMKKKFRGKDQEAIEILNSISRYVSYFFIFEQLEEIKKAIVKIHRKRKSIYFVFSVSPDIRKNKIYNKEETNQRIKTGARGISIIIAGFFLPFRFHRC